VATAIKGVVMKNVKILAPVSSGRTWLAKKILNAFDGKIGYCSIIDELLVSKSYEYTVSPELREKFIYICLGFTELSKEDIERKKFTLEKQNALLEESRQWKEFAEKRNLKYFDVTKRGEKTYDDIVEWVRTQI